MSTWSSRLLSSSPKAHPTGPSLPVTPDRNAATDHPVPNPLNVPESKPPASSHRGHSRSFSNPFPPLFGASKRAEKRTGRRELLLDPREEESSNRARVSRSNSPQKTAARVCQDEQTTGQCMTCDSTVRWPSSVKVFRCSVCLMVNDLEPLQELEEYEDTPGKAGSHPGLKLPRKALPLSIDKTKAILDRCISSYLQSHVDHLEGRSPPQPVQPDDRLNVESKHVPRQRSPSRSIPPSDSAPSIPSLTSSPYVAPQMKTPSRSPSGLSGVSSPGDTGQPLETSSPQRAVRYDAHPRSSPFDGDIVPGKKVSISTGPQEPNDEGAKPALGTPQPFFRPLENYIMSSFNGCECLNDSFLTGRPPRHRASSEGHRRKVSLDVSKAQKPVTNTPVFKLDAKTLLLGDVAENGLWWTGDQRKDEASGEDPYVDNHARHSSRSPHINWAELLNWYNLIVHAGESWMEKWEAIKPSENESMLHPSRRTGAALLQVLEQEISEARLHLHRTLLKATENLLKRPKRPLKKPGDIRFLLILLANPLLYTPNSSRRQPSAPKGPPREPSTSGTPKMGGSVPVIDDKSPARRKVSHSTGRSGGAGNHYGIIKRILGLLSHLPNECHNALTSWFSRYSEPQLQRSVDLIGSFVTYRLTRQHGRRRSEAPKAEDAFVANIPSFDHPRNATSAQMYAAINDAANPTVQKSDEKERKRIVYTDDWQIRAAARVMSLFFSANNSHHARKRESAVNRAKSSGHSHGQALPIYAFYNSLLDYSDLIADFETWESRRSKFSFCQYPFFLSIWAKIHILEYDARRQMEVKAREAFFDSILSRKAVSQYLVLKVRRDCLVDDSLREVSAVVGSTQGDTKKGLKIEFIGEEGVDAGGLRKEWFLLLVREVFDPNHGLFEYDDDSQFCYFNPYCFESSEQFFLVGVVLGLAIYNSTILDVALPPFAFRKLLASAPLTSTSASTSRSSFTYTLEDLAEYRPALARGLKQLLEYDGDVQETFCRDFMAQVDRYGQIIEVPLCPRGETKPVTNSNRREFVDLYVRYMLDTAVARQFEPFKRGFYTVVGGNALSLFRPEEIELLVRGSDESLDVASLRAVATYDHWKTSAPEQEPVIMWFWDFFGSVSAKDQRKILSFITGSDRIPAMGATSLIIRLVCLGDDTDRFPTARTCFNTVSLYRYSSRAKLEQKLWQAVAESEGFGLK